MSKADIHTFWCPNCGNLAIPLSRPRSCKRERLHRKMLYCYHCKDTFNCIECKTDDEIKEFQENFKNGVYKDEVKQTLEFKKGDGKNDNFDFNSWLTGVR